MKQRKRNKTYRSMYDERRYGFYWYSGLWYLLRPVMVLICSVIVVAGLASTIWRSVYNNYLAPVDAKSVQTIPFTVSSGSSLTKVSRTLEEAGLIRSKTVFKYYCDFAGMGQKIQSGSYELTPAMTMNEIADRLTKGDGNPIVRTITLIPGWTIEDFAQKLYADGVIADLNAFLQKCRTGQLFKDFYYISDVLADRKNSQRKYVLEGYLAPNTYEVYTNATDEEIIRKLLSQTEQVFPSDAQDRASDLGYTMDQMIILASMIEKEARTDDFTKVSAVFHNRLKAKMMLQSDVTIHYVTGVRKMNLESADLAVSSPYNTYKNKGLPVGPVCNPSQDAIYAALYPDETFVAQNYLYFCAKDPDSGELVFTKTLAEHEQAVAIYAPLWKKYDEQRGI